MRYALKDYQEDAVGEVLRHLTRAQRDWHQWKSPVALSLTATTGAGKTVMAAAVIEALFHGNPAFEFDSDPGAVVLWFTDDPSLNEQTRFRLLDASDRIAHSRLVVIENTFNQAKLEPGKVYFLNRQKLGKKSLLVRGAPEHSQLRAQRDLLPMPDARAFTMWDTLANTIGDEHLTLCLILDEAHRGMKPPNQSDRAEKATIVQRLINGANGVPPVPIVWGISATVQRFNDAMARAEGRTTYPPVVVDPARIQESGLLKDDIRLDFPTEAGQFSTVLLARATRKVKEATDRWRAYSEREGVSADTVVPLLVVQGAEHTLGRLASIGFHDDLGDVAGTRRTRDGPCLRRTRADQGRRVLGPPRSTGDCAGPHRHSGAFRQGRHLHWLGLPASRGARVVSPSSGRDAYHPAPGSNGPDAAGQAGTGRRRAELRRVPVAAL